MKTKTLKQYDKQFESQTKENDNVKLKKKQI